MPQALTINEYFSLSPFLILLATALFLILLETCKAGKWATPITCMGMILALWMICICPESTHPLLTPWIQFDSLARLFSALFLGIGLGTVLISCSFFKRFRASQSEYFFLLSSCLFGLVLISSANDFLTLFLGIETLSIALYVLCGYMKQWNLSHEAAIKYFLLGAISTSFLLFGIALIYGAAGSTRFELLRTISSKNALLFSSGLALVALGLLFKAAIVPFHVWAPDVYAGSPTPVTAFMAVGTKAGAFAALMRIFLYTVHDIHPLWNHAIALFAYPTLIYANFVALRQVQLRQFFAYSGISHAGFLLLPLAAATANSTSAMFFYIVVYTLATLGCFAVMSFLDDTREGVMIQDMQGLFYTSPFLAAIFSLCLLTLGGIPPTVGFFAKFYIFREAFAAGYYGLVVVGLLTTILSACYYLRIVALLFTEADASKKPIASWPTSLATAFFVVSLVLLSCYPDIILLLIPINS